MLLHLPLLLLPRPHTAAAGAPGQTPSGRHEWMRDVFQRDRDVPLKNSRMACGPGARSAEGARTGCAFFWLLFFAQAKNSNSPQRGESSVFNNAKSQLGSDHGKILRNGDRHRQRSGTKDGQLAQRSARV
ncbi:hypothetical protein EIP98_18260 [Xanthomonas campestris pv. raphani]